MPFKEALFWVGITVFGTGLFFLVERGEQTPVAIAFTVIGSLAIGYSVYAHYRPNGKTRLPVWTSLLLATWLFIGYDFYDRHETSVAHFLETSSFQTVVDKHFKGETVVLDGRTFTGCTFENVEFVYHGRQGFQMTYSKFLSSPLTIRTDNQAAFMLLHWIGTIDRESAGHGHFVISLVDKKGNLVN